MNSRNKRQPKTVSVIPFLIFNKKKQTYTLMIGRADDDNGEYEQIRIPKRQFNDLVRILECTVVDENDTDITFSHV